MKQKQWPWYIGGPILGLVVIFAFITGHPVGTATTYERVTGGILQLFAPGYVESTVHYAQEASTVFEWQTFFVVGIIIAGLIGRMLITKAKPEDAPKMWVENFGASKGTRYVHAFLGGLLLLFGSRLAGGCTSGLFISGGSQLAVASLVFAAGMFASGIITAKLLYRRRNA